MKIVIIQPYNTPYRNELFNTISRFEDIDLYLIYISQKTEDRKWKDVLNVSFKEIQISNKQKTIDYEHSSFHVNYFDLCYKFIAINPDVIIGVLDKYTILLRYLFFWKTIKLIHWSEETDITSSGKNWYKNRFYLRIHLTLPRAFLFPGALSFEHHRQIGFNVNDQNSFIAPNSVDDIFKIGKDELENKFEQSKIRILFIGSFVKGKGFDLLLEAFDKLRKIYNDLILEVGGAGPISPCEWVVDHGFLTKEETIALYKNCQIFIMPSLFDCNPLSVIEAAKCGCALLVSDGVGNYPELINDNGYVFERGRVNAIVNSVETILSKSKEELKSMGRRSVELSNKITHQNTATAFYNAINYSMDQ